MKKITIYGKNKIVSAALVFACFAIAASAIAATVSFSLASISAKEGQNFNAGIFVDPQGVKAYTVKLEIKYLADALEVESFSFGTGWTPLIQPGYDLIDNKNGTLIKTAGYSGGLNSKASFGTIIFKSKKNGHTIVQITTNSLALGADMKNAMNGLPVEASVLITPIAPPAETPHKPSPVPPLPTPKPKPSTQEKNTPAQTPSPAISPTQIIEPSPTPTQSPQTAQVISSFGSSATLLLIAVIVGIIGLVSWIVIKRKKS